MPVDQALRVIASGAVFGLGAGLLLLGAGRGAGFSGIVAHVLDPTTRHRSWRLALLAGVLLVATVALRFDPTAVSAESARAWPTVALAGLLVGFGTRLGNGCTSGHGICGLARLSPRSFAATLTFFAAAFATSLLFAFTERALT